jgi:tryprostatin B 6-hydroxylase
MRRSLWVGSRTHLFAWFTNHLSKIGPYSCIGKPLALLNIRSTIAKLIMTFDVALADGEDGMSFERDTKTQFTAAPGDLYIQFTKR